MPFSFNSRAIRGAVRQHAPVNAQTILPICVHTVGVTRGVSIPADRAVGR